MPPSLESLPPELRQHIFALAFDDAAAQDYRLNELVRTCILRQDGLLRLGNDFIPNFMPTWRAALGEPSRWANVHAPHIGTLATTLCATYPLLQDDVSYVLERNLAEFEDEQKVIMSAIDETIEHEHENLESRDAKGELGRRAKARGERHDIDNWTVHELETDDEEEGWQLCGWKRVSISPWFKGNGQEIWDLRDGSYTG
ncbi:hypothetical protein E2P81_ATG03296 [Venturia nashicola]|uniref:Uncharacterized protein n=1 Tax=Venturia nashicola TaxID=86259 RepID=A0A4Z1P9W0_9PEZI|nr:hypothetical protein E6O75_ATG03365 [Venturia nashicola]TLD36407.1 hypothetical protein E2P81_ATG03296 [Venturia nashicola]